MADTHHDRRARETSQAKTDEIHRGEPRGGRSQGENRGEPTVTALTRTSTASATITRLERYPSRGLRRPSRRRTRQTCPACALVILVRLHEVRAGPEAASESRDSHRRARWASPPGTAGRGGREPSSSPSPDGARAAPPSSSARATMSGGPGSLTKAQDEPARASVKRPRSRKKTSNRPTSSWQPGGWRP